MRRTLLLGWTVGWALIGLANLEPARVVISGDDVRPMLAEVKRSPMTNLGMRSTSSTLTTATTLTSPYMHTVYAPCAPSVSATSGSLCVTQIPATVGVSR